MKFLAINTAGEAVEAVLYLNGKTVFRRDAQFKKANTVCLPFVDELLNEAQIALSSLDFIGICIGPGSFTGIRIGLTVVRAFAQFASLPLVPVTATEVLAYDTECVCAVTLLDAANGFVYAAHYEGLPRTEIIAPQVIRQDEVAQFLSGVQQPFCICADSVCKRFVTDAIAEKADCSSLVEAVKAAYHMHGTVDYRTVSPLYVRKSQAEERFGQ